MDQCVAEVAYLENVQQLFWGDFAPVKAWMVLINRSPHHGVCKSRRVPKAHSPQQGKTGEKGFSLGPAVSRGDVRWPPKRVDQGFMRGPLPPHPRWPQELELPGGGADPAEVQGGQLILMVSRPCAASTLPHICHIHSTRADGWLCVFVCVYYVCFFPLQSHLYYMHRDQIGHVPMS